MFTLGINAVFHDSSACLIGNGKIIAAAEEERFTRIKHGKRPIPFSTWELPFYAIDYCLKAAGLHLNDIDHIAYSFDPFPLLGSHRDEAVLTLPLEPSRHPTSDEWLSAWDPLFLSSIVNASRHLVGGYPHHLQDRFRGARLDGPYRWHFVAHHLAHAASAFYPSPFHDAAIVTLDGRGEKATTNYAIGHGSGMEVLGQVHMPHSLGLLYEEVTRYLGFLHSSDEYKVMALASFGKPVFREEFRQIVQLGANGEYRIEHSLRLEERFGPARLRGGELTRRHFDIARSLQVTLEETVTDLAFWLKQKTGAENLCMAGGVALNCVMNSAIRDRGPFKRVWVQPAAGDAGTSIGAAFWIDAQERLGSESRTESRGRPVSRRELASREEMTHVFFGPSYDDQEIEQFLRWTKVRFRSLSNVPEEAAKLLADDKIIGWFQGRMEMGPRALGARSILASPIHAEMQTRLNDIKEREDFRPVAPVVLEDEAAKWFRGASFSPFMLFVHEVLPEAADKIPAVRHVDGTARVQTINRSQNERYYDLLKAFEARTGVPVLVNTSFNTRGEPIVCTPRDALECFWTSPLDALVIGSFLVEKSNG